MSWIIHVIIGVGIGIMFSVTYPDLAISINNSIEPSIQKIGEWGLEKFGEIIKSVVTNLIRNLGAEI